VKIDLNVVLPATNF